MKITDRIRRKFPNLADEDIVDVLVWNKKYNHACVKEVCRKVALASLYAACGVIAILVATGIISTIINLFI